jgi:hypothetical protein
VDPAEREPDHDWHDRVLAGWKHWFGQRDDAYQSARRGLVPLKHDAVVVEDLGGRGRQRDFGFVLVHG